MFSSAVQANQSGSGGDNGSFLYYWWFYTNPYYPSDRRVPYFSEHPPVYYSFPVPRTYGYSPWAYPGTYRTPEVDVALAKPLLVPNPHVGSQAAPPHNLDQSTRVRRRPGPLVVNNPYVNQRIQVANAR